MRADMYRIFRGKAIYITFALMLLTIILTVLVFRIAPSTGVSVGVGDAELGSAMPVATETMNGSIAARIALVSMNILFYFSLPLIVAVAMAAFSSGAVKNELSVGISRIQFYFSKWILSTALCFAFMFLYLSLSALLAIGVDGLGYWGSGYFADILKSFGMQMFFMAAINSLGISLCFITRKTAAAIGIYIAFALVPMILVGLLSVAFPGAGTYLNFDLINQFNIFAHVSDLSRTDFVRGIAVGLAYLLIPATLGIMVFRKAEIK